jgi:hypothetical protein
LQSPAVSVLAHRRASHQATLEWPRYTTYCANGISFRYGILAAQEWKKNMRGSLQSARLPDLDPGDLVEFICTCRYKVVVSPLVLRVLRGKRFIPDDTKISERLE